MNTRRKILIALDSSDFSNEVIRVVGARVWQPGTTIMLLTVVPTAAEYELTEECLHQAALILAERSEHLRTLLPKCTIDSECVEGLPARTIVETAKNISADLLILGSHGDTGPRATTFGTSVSSDIVNNAPCSVEILKLNRAHRARAGKK